MRVPCGCKIDSPQGWFRTLSLYNDFAYDCACRKYCYSFDTRTIYKRNEQGQFVFVKKLSEEVTKKTWANCILL